jgi:ribosomal-protein-alanine N-acetyltransferase
MENPTLAGESIQTKRLRLLPLSITSLQLYLENIDELEHRLGLSVSRDILTDRLRSAIGMKIDRMITAPLPDHVWYTYWLIVIAAENFGAGLAGFKGIDAGKREVEIGYGIDPACQRLGYTSEAVQALVEWAFHDPECHRITARKTLKNNLASLRVLEKCGFRIFSMREDSYDLVLDRRWMEVSSGLDN